MKRYDEPVHVELAGRRPTRIHRRGVIFRVQEIIDWWVVQGRWWSAEERRVHFRLLTDRGMMELYRRGDSWTLYRLFD